MAAPSGTVWGSIKDSYARLGMYISTSSTNTQTTVTVQVWFWSKYSVSDSNNSYFFNDNATAASTLIGDVTISTTVASGDGWSTSNQQLIKTHTITRSRATSAKSYTCTARLSGVDRVADGASMVVSASYTIPALPTYKVSYNANGGSGAPSSQTKTYGVTLTLSSTKPTRTGYSFQGWGTSASDTSVDYAAGASYTGNAALTLYAIWKANTYTVSYNANGGSGAPSSQTKTYGVTLTLSTTKPTRTNYTFLGWATSTSATSATYAAGGSYTNNVAVTLYAVWEPAYTKPKISSLSATRCNSSGAPTDDGTCALVKFNWSTTNSVSSVKVEWVSTIGTDAGSITISSASGTSDTASTVIDGSFDTELSYSFTVTVEDSGGATNRSVTMSGIEFHIDMGEYAVAIGKPAEKILDTSGNAMKNFDSKWLAKFRNHVCVGDKIGCHDGLQGIFLSYEGFMHLQRTTAQGYHPYIGFYFDDSTTAAGIVRVNSSTKAMQFTNAATYEFDDEIDALGHMVFATNNANIYGTDANGAKKSVFIPQNSIGNTVIGYGNYTNASGQTNIYGYDLAFGVANIATPTTYKPYFRRGDTISVSIRTAGYVTDSKRQVSFVVPLSRPIVGSPSVTAASSSGFIFRQNGSYTHGSSASVYAKPDSYVADISHCGVVIRADFTTTTDATNNSAIGIYWSGTITFA